MTEVIDEPNLRAARTTRMAPTAPASPVATSCGRARSASPPSVSGPARCSCSRPCSGGDSSARTACSGRRRRRSPTPLYIEAFPVSPLILNPFSDPLPILQALKPLSPAEVAALYPPPGPGVGQQNSFGNETHQIWPDAIGFPDPIVYEIKVQVAQHSFTTSQVLPINALGQPTQSFDANGNTFPAGTVRNLPPSTIYGFNGTFPGPMINTEYGKPALVRFSNHLDENPLNLDRQDFGDPELGS